MTDFNWKDSEEEKKKKKKKKKKKSWQTEVKGFVFE
jgi:hypothetical protein